MSILSKAIYRHLISPKIPMAFLTEVEKTTVKSVWDHKRPQVAKAVPRKQNKAGGITLPGFKLYIKL